MISAAVDYAQAIALLDRHRLPAYVSFQESGDAWGLAKETDLGAAGTIYVRTSDGTIVAGPHPPTPDEHVNDKRDSNPITRPAFDPACYRARSEETATWNGQPAVRFNLQPTCGSESDDSPFTTLYADPKTLRPLAVEGTFSEQGVAVYLNQSYDQVGGYTLPTVLKVDVAGHGFLFWVHEHARVEYTNYRFYPANPVTRRQAAAP